jgi:formamidopyrimidine-DNA glycosylase
MPELPEMQALAERLNDAVGGTELTRIEVLQFSGLKTVSPGPDDLYGRTLERVGRRGKYLVFSFGEDKILAHLSQGGRVDLEEPPKRTKPKAAVTRLVFGTKAILIKEFGTERKAAWWVLPKDEPGPLENLGPEPFSDEAERLVLEGEDKRRLHTTLRDQRTIAGIGRGFTDDILHLAKLSPFESLSSLTGERRRNLLDAIHTVLEAATEKERERTGGLPTKIAGRFNVHGHFGEACPRCKDPMQHVSYESHEIVYCPRCQTGGKVLADRRMSRLLK